MSERALDELIGLRNPSTGSVIGSALVASADCPDPSREDCQPALKAARKVEGDDS